MGGGVNNIASELINSSFCPNLDLPVKIFNQKIPHSVCKVRTFVDIIQRSVPIDRYPPLKDNWGSVTRACLMASAVYKIHCCDTVMWPSLAIRAKIEDFRMVTGIRRNFTFSTRGRFSLPVSERREVTLSMLMMIGGWGGSACLKITSQTNFNEVRIDWPALWQSPHHLISLFHCLVPFIG